MIAPVLGIDPGVAGGAALLDEDGGALWACRWVPLDRKAGRVWRVDHQGYGEPKVSIEVRSLAGVGVVLGLHVEPGKVHLAVEDLYVASMARQDAAIALGRSVGWLTAHLVDVVLSYSQVRARKWRPAVLGCSPATSSDDAEELALQRWRPRWVGELREVAAVAEADCIAWYRRTELRVEAAQPALMEPSRKRRAR